MAPMALPEQLTHPLPFIPPLPSPHAPDAIPTLTNATKFNDLPAILQDLLNDIESVSRPPVHIPTEHCTMHLLPTFVEI